jgi:hypothetical protein
MKTPSPQKNQTSTNLFDLEQQMKIANEIEKEA